MQTASLVPFPSAHAPLLTVDFTAERLPERIDFVFNVNGPREELAKLLFPGSAKRRRRDELWKHSCFEIFLAVPDSNGYIELNLAPSGDWNVYTFSDYRVGMAQAEQVSEPFLHREDSALKFSLFGQLSANGESSPIANLLKSGRLVMNATAVLEYDGGKREHWALAHNGEKADFHQRSCFVLEL